MGQEDVSSTMKTRTKIVLTIAAAVVYWMIVQTFLDSTRHVSAFGMTVEQLQNQYAVDNDRFFDDKLPKKVVIDYGETNPQYMATTAFRENEFHISLNPTFARAERVDKYLLLHEACHMDTWSEGVEHGPDWRVCMLKIDAQGGFREIFIDEYQEKMP